MKLAKDLKKEIERLMEKRIISISEPPQGMSSFVVFIKFDDGMKVVAKVGEIYGDKITIQLLEKNKINVPFPRILGEVIGLEKKVLLIDKIDYPLLEDQSKDEIVKYLPSMIINLQEIHKLKSEWAGYLLEGPSGVNWKQVLINNLEDNNQINWGEIQKRSLVNSDLLQQSRNKLIRIIQNIDMISQNYSLLHTDFNQRNLLVDPESYSIAGIIDWEEAMYGDPIFDFARIRMLLWHYDLSADDIQIYYKLVNFSKEEKHLEQIYWLYRIIEYLAWYSEDLNEFNIGRINMHQVFLEEYDWRNLHV